MGGGVSNKKNVFFLRAGAVLSCGTPGPCDEFGGTARAFPKNYYSVPKNGLRGTILLAFCSLSARFLPVAWGALGPPPGGALAAAAPRRVGLGAPALVGAVGAPLRACAHDHH